MLVKREAEQMVVDQLGDWSQFIKEVPKGSKAVGVIEWRSPVEWDKAGALICMHETGHYYQCNKEGKHKLDGRRVLGALGLAGRPSSLKGGKRSNFYLDDETTRIAKLLGGGNLSLGIRKGMQMAMSLSLPNQTHTSEVKGLSTNSQVTKDKQPDWGAITGGHTSEELCRYLLKNRPQWAESQIKKMLRESMACEFDYEIHRIRHKSAIAVQLGFEEGLNGAQKTATRIKTGEALEERPEDLLPILLNNAREIVAGLDRHTAAGLNAERSVLALIPIGKGTGEIVNLVEYTKTDAT